MILDYSPTAALACKILGIQSMHVGNGFELPPLEDPLPPFPGFSWATALAADRRATAVVNAALRRFGRQQLLSLRDVFVDAPRFCLSWPEIIHYGDRSDVQCVRPIFQEFSAAPPPWPRSKSRKIFAVLRRDTSHVNEILAALSTFEGSIICVAIGFSDAELSRFQSASLVFRRQPLNLDQLADATLCLTYGAEGTMLKFLSLGIPQAIAPWHVEAFMAARQMAMQGIADLLCSDGGVNYSDAINTVRLDLAMESRARSFARVIFDRIAQPAVKVIADTVAN